MNNYLKNDILEMCFSLLGEINLNAEIISFKKKMYLSY